MKITKLHIYGFGKFSNVHIDFFSSNLQVIFGENEKGKSTIKAFITTILFGFPTKAQAGAHYEPKQGTKYGGKLFIETNHFGVITIERQKGKNSGKAIVYFEDGTVGGEEAIEQVIGGMDKGIFAGIFSFSASDLQKMEQLKTDELNQYLHGATMWGKGSLNELEKKIEKGQQHLFKPTGKKPELNERLQQLEEIRLELKEMEEKLSQYDELIHQRTIITNQNKELTETITALHEAMKRNEQLKLIEPLYIKEKSITSQLEQMPFVENFPMYSIEQVKNSLTKEQALKEQCNELKIRVEEQQDKLKQFTLYPHFEQLKEHAIVVKDLHYEFNQLNEEITSIALELESVEREVVEQLERLGQDWNEQTILQTESSLTAKERLRKLAKREQNLHYERDQISIELKTKLLKLEQTKQTITDLFSQCLTKEQNIELQHQLREIKEEYSKRKEIEQQIQWLALQFEHGKKQNNSWLFIAIIVILGILSGWMWFIQQWIPFVFASLLTIIMIVVIVKQQNSVNKKELHQRKIYEQKLETIPQTMELERQMNDMERIIKESEAKEQQLQVWKKQAEQEDREYDLLEEEVQNCERDIQSVQHQLMDWCDQYGFVCYESCDHQLELFDLVMNVKQLLKKKENYQNRQAKIKERLEQIERKAVQLATELGINSENLSVLVYKITNMLEEEQTKRVQFHEKEKSLLNTEAELETVNRKVEYLQEERMSWLKKAEAKNEEVFFELADIALRRKELEKELLFLRSQQAQFLLDGVTKEQVINELDHKTISIDEELEKLTDQLKESEEERLYLQNQAGRIEHEIEQLENGGDYSQLSQTFETKKDEFQRIAKEWATYRVAQLILAKAKSIYETERQPVVIQKAKELFTLMTNGRYTNLFAPVTENVFIVERNDGMRFSPGELSQGTSEQLYVSLRLALALAYQAPTPMPILLDDIMINFDDERKTSAIRVIQEVAKKHQVLFFTCHQQVKDLFDLEATLVLS